MGNIISAIHTDRERLVALCQRYGITPDFDKMYSPGDPVSLAALEARRRQEED